MSHAHTDFELASRTALVLEARGLKPLLDFTFLVPGRPYHAELGERLADCDGLVVLVGTRGLTAWQQREWDLARSLHAGDDSFVIVVAVLPGGQPPLGSLRSDRVVHVRSGAHAVDAIIDALTADSSAAAPPPAQIREPASCPYRGLRPFREEDAALFFGRDSVIGELRAALARRPLVVLVGPSGAGKTSVVHAGLVPALRRASDPGWGIVALAPGERPVNRLARALYPAWEPRAWRAGSKSERLDAIADLEQRLLAGEHRLEEVAEGILDESPGAERVLVVVDGWEDLYSPRVAPGERTRFIAILLEAIAGERVSVVVTAQGAVLDEMMSHPGIDDALAGARIVLGAPGDDDLRACIERPARELGVVFDTRLPGLLIRDAGHGPDSLPILEFALTRLWTAGQGPTVTLADYESIGSVGGALEGHAEQIYAGLSGAQRRALPALFTRLVHVGEHAVLRRRAPVSELGPSSVPLVRKLAETPLITLSTDEDDETLFCELSHNALARNWRRLHGWIEADRRFLLWRQTLAVPLESWRQSGRDRAHLLRGERLVEARAYLRTHLDRLSEAECELIRASHRYARRAVVVAAGVAGAVVVTLAALSLVTLERTREARESLRLLTDQYLLAGADRAEDPLIALQWIRRLSGAAEPVGGLAVAYRLLSRHVPRHVFAHHEAAVGAVAFDPTGEAVVSASEDGTARIRRIDGAAPTIVLAHPGPVLSAEFARDGKSVLTTCADGTARIWASTGQGPPLELRAEEFIRRATFNAPGTHVLAVGREREAYVWSIADPEEPVVLAHRRRLSTASFSPAGDLVVTAARDEVQIWELDGDLDDNWLVNEDVGIALISPDGEWFLSAEATGLLRWVHASKPRRRMNLPMHSEVSSVVFMDDALAAIALVDGRVVKLDLRGPPATVFDYQAQARRLHVEPGLATLLGTLHDGSARIWNFAVGGTVDLRASSAIRAADLAPRGARVATGHDDGSVRVWSIDARPLATQLPNPAVVLDIAISRDGRYVATGANDSMARILRVDGSETPRGFAHGDHVWTVEFDRAGTRLLTASSDGKARIWDLGSGELSWTAHHEAVIYSAEFSPDETRILVAAQDRNAYVWHVGGATELVLEHPSAVTYASFSPDGRRVVTGTRAGVLRVWDLATREILASTPVSGTVNTVRFDPAGQRVVAWLASGLATIWNVEPGELRTLESRDLASASFDPRSGRTVTGSLDGTVRITGEAGPATDVVLSHPGLMSVEIAPGGRVLLTGGQDGAVRLWSLDWGDLRSRLEARAPITMELDVALPKLPDVDG